MPESRPVLGGLHHVTAICSDPQLNLDFYEGVLGLRFVKKTVNFDDPGSYHLYYGDGVGSPGTLLTFFAWTGLPPMASGQGRAGTGTIVTTSFRVPADSIPFWTDRFAERAIDFRGPTVRFGEAVLTVRDPDGLEVELVAGPGPATKAPWDAGPVPAAAAIQGLHGVVLCVADPARTGFFLRDALGASEPQDEAERVRFRVGEEHGGWAELVTRPDAEAGRIGVGVVHHVAWRARDASTQAAWRLYLMRAGLSVTPVMDRRYFESIYFREPTRVEFEIATDGPGFTTDEDAATLGTGLMLPPWLESRRPAIEARLPSIVSHTS